MNIVGTIILVLAVLGGAILLIPRRTRFVGYTFFALGCGGIGFFIWQYAQWSAGYESVQMGASEQEVITRVGKPPRVTDGSEWVVPGYKKGSSELVPGCVREYWYPAFLTPEQYSFCFSAEAKLIKKYHWVSY